MKVKKGDRVQVLTGKDRGKEGHVLLTIPDQDKILEGTGDNTVVATVDIGLKPQDVTYAPDGKHLYTANVDDGTVDVVNTATNVVTARIPTGKSPSSISVLPNGKQAFVTNLDDGTVRILDITAV